jgi:hypothetical protein
VDTAEYTVAEATAYTAVEATECIAVGPVRMVRELVRESMAVLPLGLISVGSEARNQSAR